MRGARRVPSRVSMHGAWLGAPCIVLRAQTAPRRARTRRCVPCRVRGGPTAPRRRRQASAPAMHSAKGRV